MRRLLLLLIIVGLLAVPANAAAATHAVKVRPSGAGVIAGEQDGNATLPELPVTPMDGNPGCLGATGAPGELTFSAAGSRGVRFLHADRTGVTRAQTLAVPACSTVVSRPNGAAVAAGDTESGVVGAVRDPGGAWGTPLDLVDPSAWHPRLLAAAVSDRGDAVVAWSEDTFEEPDSEPQRVLVARRAPGGGFGEAQTLVTGENEIESVRAGVAANGDAFTLRLRRVPAAPQPHVTRVSAVRRGKRVIVRWATDRPLSGDIIAVVSGAPARKERGEPLQAVGVSVELPRRSFARDCATTLTRNAGAIRFVTLRANRAQNPARDEPMTVEVR